MKKVYIAGPDVFELDSVEIGAKYVALCKEYGFEGLYPLDNVVDFNQPKQKIAQDIYHANVAMIEQADIVIANLNMFRGKEADSGTVWECGYAHAKGKKVYGYMKNTQNYMLHFEHKVQHDTFYLDEDQKIIEDFDYPLNLMIACSCEKIIQGGFEDVLKLIRG